MKRQKPDKEEPTSLLDTAQSKKAKKSVKSYSESCNQNVTFNWSFVTELSATRQLNPRISQNVIKMLDDGCSIPFISRYRQNETGGMQPEDLRKFQDSYEDLKKVRKEVMKLLKSASIDDKPRLESLTHQLCSVKSMDELEIVSAPLKKEKSTSLAAKAKKAGLESAAIAILENESNVQLKSLCSSEMKTVTEVENGIQHIIADRFGHDKDVLDFVMSICSGKNTFLQSSKAKETKAALAKKEAEKTDDSKFQDYFDFSSSLENLKSHQILALNRGEKKKVLSIKIEAPASLVVNLQKYFERNFIGKGAHCSNRAKILTSAFDYAVKNFIMPWVSRRFRKQLTEKAEQSSIESFCSNLRSLLMESPTRDKVIMGIDPGFKNGCKIAIIDRNGSVLYTGKILPNFRSQLNPLGPKESENFSNLVKKFQIDVIAIGNGVGCRATEVMIANMVKSNAFHPQKVVYVIVNEQGASIYSCSKIAKEENPGIDVSLLGAVSIARRLQDPLSEYVKIDPWHLGVGMYQHDVKEAKLKQWTESVVEECVSFIGLDLNFAPLHMLKRVAGIGDSIAKNLIEWRKKNKEFKNREELKKVKGIGAMNYQQMAGFLRIFHDDKTRPSDDINPMDSLLIHPEMYGLAANLIKKHGCSVQDIGQSRLIARFQRLKDQYEGDKNSKLVIEALSEPLKHDIRAMSGPIFREGIASVNDLQPGKVLDGKVLNVVDFGAFVDIGVEKNGLIHSSNMNGMRVQLGQRVRVEVVNVEARRGRIGLRLKEIM